MQDRQFIGIVCPVACLQVHGSPEQALSRGIEGVC